MRLVPLSTNSLRLGQPLPFSIRDAQGRVLIAKGARIAEEVGLERFLDKDLWVDGSEADAHQQGYARRLEAVLRNTAGLASPSPAASQQTKEPAPNWPTLLFRTTALLHDAAPKNLITRTDGLRCALQWHLAQDADQALLVLVRSATLDIKHYAAWHSLLVAAVCQLCMQHLSEVAPPTWQNSLMCAALTMNISITQLQNRLAMQEEPLTVNQRLQIQDHSNASVRLLLDGGVVDGLWLDAILHHHDATPGPLETRSPGQRLGRIIQRADLFAARLSPRANRVAMSPIEAVQVTYFDENRKPDFAGAALIKAVGVYPPGGLVELSNGERAIVLRRGKKGTHPLVAVLVNKAKTALEQPVLRDTSEPQFAVTRSLAAHEIEVSCELDALLQLY